MISILEKQSKSCNIFDTIVVEVRWVTCYARAFNACFICIWLYLKEILEPLATKALILSYPQIIMCNTILTLIGISYEFSRQSPVSLV